MLAHDVQKNSAPAPKGSGLQSPEIGETSVFFAEEERIRYEKIRNDVGKRLRKVCGDLSEASFQVLVEKLTSHRP